MSTVHEVIAARHCGVKVLAFSLITNLCETEDDDEEIVENGNTKNGHNENGNSKNADIILEELNDVIIKRGPILKQFVSILVQHLDKET
jgi:purine-nucleoside phosphorylase